MQMITQLRELPYAAKVLLATNGVSALGGGLVLPFLWIYLSTARHLPLWVPAVTLAVQAATAVGAGLIWGAAVGKLPQRVIVPAVMVISGVGTSLYAVVTTPAVAIIAAVFYGVGISGLGTVLRVMYAATTRQSQREFVFSLDYAVLNVMMGVGVAVGGVIVVAVHALPLADRYTVLYLGDGLSFFITAVATAILLPASRWPGRPGRPEAKQEGYRAILRDRRLVLLLVIMLVLMVVSIGQVRSGIPGYLTLRHAVGAGGLSFVFTLNIIVVVGVQFLVLPRLNQIRRITLVAISGVLFTLCWVFVWLAGIHHGRASIALLAVGMILLSGGEGFLVPVLTALINNVIPDELRNRTNALLSMAISSSSVIAPAITGAALPWHRGLDFAFGMIAASAAATLLVLVVRPLMPARPARAAESSLSEPASA